MIHHYPYGPYLMVSVYQEGECLSSFKRQSDRIKRNPVEFYMVLLYMPSKCELKGRMSLVVLNGSKSHDNKSIVNIFY